MPRASASSALTNRPVKIRSLALLGPTSRESRWVPPMPGITPSSDLGLAERGVVGGEADVGAQGELAAAAQRVARDRGDDRLGDVRRPCVISAWRPADAATMSACDMSAISLTSAPAAKVRSPP